MLPFETKDKTDVRCSFKLQLQSIVVPPLSWRKHPSANCTASYTTTVHVWAEVASDMDTSSDFYAGQVKLRHRTKT
jgi:hypothetical protein